MLFRSNGLVVKDNALINASYNLELTEQRLIMLAIINARELGQGITADSKLEIHASDYAKLFNVSADASYKALKEAASPRAVSTATPSRSLPSWTQREPR